MKYDVCMERTTVTLPADLARSLAREAEQRDVSASQVIREALTDRYSERRVLTFIGIASGGPTDGARHIDRYLDEMLDEA